MRAPSGESRLAAQELGLARVSPKTIISDAARLCAEVDANHTGTMFFLPAVLTTLLVLVVIALLVWLLRPGVLQSLWTQFKDEVVHIQLIAETLTKAEEVAVDFEEQGFSAGFVAFNSELLRPFKRMKRDYCTHPSGIVLDVCDTLSLRPSSPKMAFIFWNVMCFWVGAIDVVLVLLLEHGVSWLSVVVACVDGLLGYLFAYTFYFLFILTCKRTKFWMRVGLVVIAAYVVGTGFLTLLRSRSIEHFYLGGGALAG